METNQTRIEPKTGRTQTLLLAGLFVFVFLAACFQVSDIDLGYHIRTGAYVWEHHQIPAVNTFSYTTPQEPWYLHQWWPATGLYLLDQFGGVYALTTAKCLLACLAMWLVWLAARRLCPPDSLWPFWFVTLATVIGRTRFFERPDFLSSIIFTLLLYLDIRFGRQRRWQWIGLPLLLAFWANTHGGLVYGVAFLFALSAGEMAEVAGRKLGLLKRPEEPPMTWRELLIRPAGVGLGLIAAAVSLELINPHGARILLVPFQFNSSFWKDTITELQRPLWAENKLFYLTLPLLAVLLALSRRHWNFARCFLLCGFALLALDAQRSILFFALAMVPFAAQMAAQIRPMVWQTNKHLSTVILPGVWLGIALFKFIPDEQYKFGYGLYPAFYPTGVFAFMQRTVPEQNVFNEMRYGGPMLWKAYPKFKPFVDGRGDAYTVSFWQKEYLPVINLAPGWQDILTRWHVSAALVPINLDHQLSPLAKQLSASPDWALVAFDDFTMLFLRRTESNHSVIKEYEFKLIHPDDWALNKISPANAAAAAREAARVLESAPNSTYGLTAAARATLVKGDYATASQFYAQLVQLPGASALYWRDYGFALFQLDQLTEADKVYAKLQRAKELMGYPAFMRYFIALKQNRRDEARQYLQQALAMEPNNEEYKAAQRTLEGK